MNDDFTLEPAQEIGMALAHAHKVTDALQRAVDAGAIVITRESTRELLREVDAAVDEFGEWMKDEPRLAVLDHVRDFLADALGNYDE